MDAEAVTWSVTVSSPPRQVAPAGSVSAERSARPRATRGIFDPALGEATATPLFWRFDLAPGSVVEGPAIIAEDETSTVVGANFARRHQRLGYIVLEEEVTAMSADALKAIRTQVMWNRLIAVVEEQAQSLLRTAFGAITREAGDLSAGVYDTRRPHAGQAMTGTPATSTPWPPRSGISSPGIRLPP